MPAVAGGARVLIIEPDPALGRAIARKLRQQNFAVNRVATAAEYRQSFDRLRPDLVLLDLHLPDAGVWGLISEVRERGVPIIVISERRAESDTVEALDLGADDFIIKPFGLDELLARVRVALRHIARPDSGTEPVLRIGSLEVDVARRQVRRGGQLIHVTPTEYQLLRVFATHPDRFVPDRTLIEKVWGRAWRGGEHILHVYIGRLRKKFEDDRAEPRYLLTESGLGYRFAADPLPLGGSILDGCALQSSALAPTSSASMRPP